MIYMSTFTNWISISNSKKKIVIQKSRERANLDISIIIKIINTVIDLSLSIVVSCLQNLLLFTLDQKIDKTHIHIYIERERERERDIESNDVV
jgi:uncharacterized protein YqgV (UPF0045/DUF77 family)